MRYKKAAGRILSALCAALLVLTCPYGTMPASAADEVGTEYIVKYNQSAAWLMQSDGVPFDVVSEAEMIRLRDAGLLEWYEPDGEGILLEEPAILLDSTYYESYQWNLDVIQAEGAFAQDCLGQGVRVGVVDSGVNPHPDLTARLLEGRNYTENASDETNTADSFGHGTKVAGLIAGAGEAGYVGAAPMAELVPLKITDEKSVKISAICRAIYGGINDFECDVLNLSLGVTGEYTSLKEAIDYAEEKGVTVVAAVGNAGTSTVYYPAGYDSVIGVGAVDRNGSLSSGSNHNDSVFLTAPGVNVRSTNSAGGYTLGTGTSFSVPQVSGAAAVLLGIDGTLTPAEIRDILAQSASDRGAEGYDEYYGYGILDLSASVQVLAERVREGPCSFLPERGPASKIRNNTDAPVSVTYLLAEYNEKGQCLDVQVYILTIPAKGTAEIRAPAENIRYGQFICQTGTMAPLTTERKPP